MTNQEKAKSMRLAEFLGMEDREGILLTEEELSALRENPKGEEDKDANREGE